MLTRLAPLLLAAAVLAFPSAAAAAEPAAGISPASGLASKVLLVRDGSPLAEVQSLDTVPLGWRSSARQAMKAAERCPTLLALHRRVHPLTVLPFVWRSTNPYWYVEFSYHGKVVAAADVSPAGKLTHAWTGVQALEPDTQGGFASVITGWFVLVPASLLFLLPFFDPRRLRRITHLDALAMLAFLISWLLLANAHLGSAVWLAYPPLIYLLVRLLMIGFGRGQPTGRLAPLLSLRTLLIGLPVILGARIVLSLVGHQEIDIGYESVIGAYRILHHLPIYYNDPNHGDTYGPVAYLAYVPFELLFPWTNSLSNLHAADAAAVVFDLGTVVGLILLGRRLRAGQEGTRLGLVLCWAWAAYPFTVIGLVVHTNDALVSMLVVFAMLALRSPLISGGLLGLAAAAKFSPAGLLPLLAAPRQRGLKGALVCVGAFTLIVVAAFFWWLPSGGLAYIWQRTLHFQMTRPDVFSPWGLHPALHPLQIALEVLAVAIAAMVAFVPRERSLVSVCALAGAVTIAIQLPVAHWYYYYLLWFLPFALVACLVRSPAGPGTVIEGERPTEPIVERSRPEPVLAGV